MKVEITQEYLKQVLHYDRETGEFLWRAQRGCKKPGEIAGSINGQGYRFIGFGGKLHLAHRLAWLYEFGEWPAVSLDHIDGNPGNNRIENLRECSHAENHQNRKMPSHNKSGYQGVSFANRERLWHAQIKVRGVKHSLGYYKTPEEASAAYLRAKRTLHDFQPIPREPQSARPVVAQ